MGSRSRRPGATARHAGGANVALVMSTETRSACHVIAMKVAITASLVLIAACRPPPPPSANEPPRLPAEEACANPVEITGALPVPARPPADPYRIQTAALIGFRDSAGFHATTFVCDLADRILAIAAQQGVDSGKRTIGGTVWTIPRVATAPAIPPVAIEPSSPGCVKGEPMCTWKTASPAMPSIDTIPNQWVATSGWVHGLEDMCRAVPDDTIATCSTATRMAYVELGCQQRAAPPVALSLGIHDASLDRRYDLDIEVPVARLTGAATIASDTTYSYRFTGPGDAKGAHKSATLTFDLAGPSAELELDGKREPCIAFALYRQLR